MSRGKRGKKREESGDEREWREMKKERGEERNRV